MKRIPSRLDGGGIMDVKNILAKFTHSKCSERENYSFIIFLLIFEEISEYSTVK
jgi:hypothetical protein